MNINAWNLLRTQVQSAWGAPLSAELDDATLRALSARAAAIRGKVLDQSPTGAYLEDPKDLAAYAALMAPRTMAAVLAELPPLPAGAAVLDLGAGGGAASMACAERGARRFTLVDHGGAALRMAHDALARVPDTEVRSVASHLGPAAEPHLTGRFDAVVLAFSLLEMAQDRLADAAAVLGWVQRHLHEDGWLLVVDSAQPERARILNGLRNAVMESGLHIHGPCPHREACPALERPRDFCHAVKVWDVPRDFKRAGEMAHLHRDRLSYSYLLLSKKPAAERHTLRVIGDVQKEKGRARVAVCSPGPMRELVVLQRHKAAFHALLDVPRGTELPHPPDATERAVRVEDAAYFGVDG